METPPPLLMIEEWPRVFFFFLLFVGNLPMMRKVKEKKETVAAP